MHNKLMISEIHKKEWTMITNGFDLVNEKSNKQYHQRASLYNFRSTKQYIIIYIVDSP